ncbi:MAG: hypothetical protein K1000chlam2_00494 [Chlamydiae bacterium]|nr:hypothetical protein [Chlamydiota bacterium]
MIKTDLPISAHNPTPNLPKPPERTLNWMGKIVKWIRAADSAGIIRKTVVYSLAIFTSMILVASVVFSLLFLYGFKEYVTQSVEARDADYRSTLYEAAKQQNRHHFLDGRTTLFDSIKIPLPNWARDKIIQDLDLSEEDAAKKSNNELAHMALRASNNFFHQYGLKIVCKGWFY